MPKKRSTYRVNVRQKLGSPSADADELKMQVQLVRLLVLHQDLLIDVSGATRADQLEAIEFADTLSKRFYFVRNALRTVWEVKQACDVLNGNRAFKAAKKSMARHNLDAWDSAVKWFQANQEDLRVWRNDVGGHFNVAAAEFVLRNVDDSLEADVVTLSDSDAEEAMAYLPLAYQLVAIALTKARRPDENIQEGLLRSFGLMRDAYRHAANVGHTVIAERLLKS